MVLKLFRTVVRVVQSAVYKNVCLHRAVFYSSTSFCQPGVSSPTSEVGRTDVSAAVAWFPVSGCLPPRHTQSLSHIMTDLLPCRLKAATQQTAGVGQNGTVYIYGVRGQAVLASLYRWTSMYSTYFFMAFAILSAGPLSHCATLPFLALNKSCG